MTHASSSPDQTVNLAADLSMRLKRGDCLALDGDLGAGKTQFVRGLVKGLGGNPRDVSSPTYVLLHIYYTQSLPVFHLDAYRVGGPADFESIGFGELLEQGGIVVVEWAARVRDLLPRGTINIRIEVLDEFNRRISISDDEFT